MHRKFVIKISHFTMYLKGKFLFTQSKPEILDELSEKEVKEKSRRLHFT